MVPGGPWRPLEVPGGSGRDTPGKPEVRARSKPLNFAFKKRRLKQFLEPLPGGVLLGLPGPCLDLRFPRVFANSRKTEVDVNEENGGRDAKTLVFLLILRLRLSTLTKKTEVEMQKP